MGKHLSLDIRERVVPLVEEEGYSHREAARRAGCHGAAGSAGAERVRCRQ